MKRWLLLVACFHCVCICSGQQDSALPSYPVPKEKLFFINKVRSLITDSLKLQTGTQFYTRYAAGDSMFIYLYVSKKDSVKQVVSVTYLYFGHHAALAREKADSFAKAGFDTMVYQTAGTSAAFINRRLLEYDDLAIAFIMIHEAMHNHIKSRIPYEYEEALCDVVANSFCGWYSNATMRDYVSFTYANEEIYRQINFCAKGKISKSKCNNRIRKQLEKASLFQKDRYGYNVNNAYLLRYSSYAKRYFELRLLYQHVKEPALFLDEMMKLPKYIEPFEPAFAALKKKYQ